MHHIARRQRDVSRSLDIDGRGEFGVGLRAIDRGVGRRINDDVRPLLANRKHRVGIGDIELRQIETDSAPSGRVSASATPSWPLQPSTSVSCVSISIL